MDMSLEETLVALGLDSNYCVPSHWQGRGDNFFAIPSGRSRNYRGDFRLTPGQNPFAPGTPGSYLDTVRRVGGPVSASSRGPSDYAWSF